MQYPDQVFQLWSPEGYQVMLPARFVPVFQNMGHQQADLAAAVEEVCGVFDGREGSDLC